MEKRNEKIGQRSDWMITWQADIVDQGRCVREREKMVRSVNQKNKVFWLVGEA
jgi:hypothetical protein